MSAYAGTVALAGDPATRIYASWQQRDLVDELEARTEGDRALVPGSEEFARNGATRERDAIGDAARRTSAGIDLGDALGRIIIPELGVRAVFVHGTRSREDLTRGPGHYVESSLPGLAGVTAIAGHRTTFGAPFREIDELERGDAVVLELPYGRFEYTVFGDEIVASDDWSILDGRGFETLVLTTCHPLYASSERWVVYARLSRSVVADA